MTTSPPDPPPPSPPPPPLGPVTEDGNERLGRCWDGSIFRGFKRKLLDRDLDFHKEFEHNAYNQWVISMIEECSQASLQYIVACNQQTLDHQEILPVKVVVHCSQGPQEDEYFTRIEPYESQACNHDAIGSTLVGTRVPVKVLFDSTRRGKPTQRVGYILSLIDVDVQDGYQVYYFRHRHLGTERVRPQAFSVLPMTDEDRETAAQISTFLAAAASAHSIDLSSANSVEESSSALSF